MSHFYCTRCGNDKDQGCGMPDFKVPVPFPDGIRMVTPACPLDYKNRFWRWLAKTGLFYR